MNNLNEFSFVYNNSFPALEVKADNYTKRTPINLDHFRKKTKIQELLTLSTIRIVFPENDCLANEMSVENSLSILEWLDDSYDLPKVALDEDGDVIFAWESRDKTCLLTIEENLLHLYSLDNNGNTLIRLDDIESSLNSFASEILPELF